MSTTVSCHKPKHCPSHPPTIPRPEPIPYLSHIDRYGINTLWIGFVIFLVATILMMGMAVRHDRRHRTFHLITMVITLVATLSYYAMAIGSGAVYVSLGLFRIHEQETMFLRQVFWARHVDWAITTPLILLDLALLAGLPWLDIVCLLVADEAWVLSGMFSVLHPGRSAGKWGWYLFSWLFLLYVMYKLLGHGRRCAKLQQSSTSSLYTQLAIYTTVLWVMYPIFSGLGEASGVIPANGETVILTILDVLTKVGFGLWLLLAHKHDEGEHGGTLAVYWTEVRGSGAEVGAIQLPGEGA
ncbi:hypothetical protein BU17DRAFT_63127 [Hysterangium stoloniferum]|nr:hypothetical protein BU17DRAFT_63127 [Hysterangium stoloniferum]